jgi:hypothetical protein
MSLHSHQFSALGDTVPEGPGDDGDASLYGSLSTLGSRKMKKKPVLMLDEQELARAHMAIAMGGAEIMDTPAARAVQPAMLLGLAPMGQDDADEDPGLYPDQAFARNDEDEQAAEDADTVDYDVDAEEELEDAATDAAYATLSPFAIDEDEDEEEDGAVEEAAEDVALPPPSYNFDHLLGGNRRKPSVGLNGEIDDEDDEDSIPSIADQLRALRERTTRPSQHPAATQPMPVAPQESAQAPDPIAVSRPAPAAPVNPTPEVVARQADLPTPASTRNQATEPTPADVRPIIERLEIDDWSSITPMRATAEPQAAAPQAAPQPPVAPPPVAQPFPAPADRVADERPVAAEPAQPAPAPTVPVANTPSVTPVDMGRDDEWDDAEWDEAVWPDEPTPEPAAVALLDPNHVPHPEPVGGRDRAGWPLDHRPPPSTLRARIREQQDMHVAAPGLLARFAQWLRRLFAL